jgi:hypothetical protein
MFLEEALKIPFSFSNTLFSQVLLTLEVLLIVIFGSETEMEHYFTLLVPANFSISKCILKSFLLICADFERLSQRLLRACSLRRSQSNELTAFLKVSWLMVVVVGPKLRKKLKAESQSAKLTCRADFSSTKC